MRRGTRMRRLPALGRFRGANLRISRWTAHVYLLCKRKVQLLQERAPVVAPDASASEPTKPTGRASQSTQSAQPSGPIATAAARAATLRSSRRGVCLLQHNHQHGPVDQLSVCTELHTNQQHQRPRGVLLAMLADGGVQGVHTRASGKHLPSQGDQQAERTVCVGHRRLLPPGIFAASSNASPIRELPAFASISAAAPPQAALATTVPADATSAAPQPRRIVGRILHRGGAVLPVHSNSVCGRCSHRCNRLCFGQLKRPFDGRLYRVFHSLRCVDKRKTPPGEPGDGRGQHQLQRGHEHRVRARGVHNRRPSHRREADTSNPRPKRYPARRGKFTGIQHSRMRRRVLCGRQAGLSSSKSFSASPGPSNRARAQLRCHVVHVGRYVLPGQLLCDTEQTKADRGSARRPRERAGGQGGIEENCSCCSRAPRRRASIEHGKGGVMFTVQVYAIRVTNHAHGAT